MVVRNTARNSRMLLQDAMKDDTNKVLIAIDNLSAKIDATNAVLQELLMYKLVLQCLPV
jgi:hypothetical protein